MGWMDDILDKPEPKTEFKDPFGVTKVVVAEDHVVVERANAVQDSRDLRRVAALPRRPMQVTAATLGSGRILTPELTAKLAELEARLRRTDDQNCQCATRWPARGCAKHLLPLQAWALWELSVQSGLVGDIGTGEGKSLLGLLASMVLPGCQTAVLLVPANLKHQMLNINVDYYGQHWKLPNISGRGRASWEYKDRPHLHILSYDEVSNKKSGLLLDSVDPDFYILDEAHKLSKSDTSRGRRFWPDVGQPEKPKTTKDGRQKRVAIMSGTLVKKSMLDVQRLAARSLGDGAPVPLHHPTAVEWAEALDPGEFAKDMGQLRKLFRVGETLYEGWKNRKNETLGWVSSPENDSCGAGLYFHALDPSVPENVQVTIDKVAISWERPDGERMQEILEQSQCLRQVGMGFFYKWSWPSHIDKEFQDQWLAARKEWRSEVREKLKRPRPHMDSPSLLEDAARRHHFPEENDNPNLPRWATDSYEEWVHWRNEYKARTGKNQPPSVAVWVSDFLVRECAEWLRKNKGIVWVKHQAFGEALAKMSGAPLYMGGKEEDVAIAKEDGRRGIVAGIDAHGTGKDLQFAFASNLFPYCSSDWQTWQQTLARTHRQGQPKDQVDVFVFRHTEAMKKALRKARKDALHWQTTEGGNKKLVNATYMFEDDEDDSAW